ncbi:GNAT family N-acetyltransferase [bacterium]|nr:GNAT family N-acetyltransferase [bacterium]
MSFPEQVNSENFRYEPFQRPEDLRRRDTGIDIITIPEPGNGLYVSGFACSPRAIEAALRLRYKIFNEELGEGLHTSRETGLDRDEFDNQMDHIVLVERGTGAVVGTYRIQTVAHALSHEGIYSGREYDLKPLEAFFPEMVETGRACISKDHRNYPAVITMWKAISVYMSAYRQRYLFGCCSLTSLDPLDGWRALKTLRGMKAVHPSISADPMAGFSCGDASMEYNPSITPLAKIPKLFSAYLRLGTQVVSKPAIDREFGTVDFLMFLDAPSVSFSQIMMR